MTILKWLLVFVAVLYVGGVAVVVGMLKLASKFAMDIFPSVIATILGAYIVNHYINAKTPAADPAAAVSTADPKKAALKAEFEAVRAFG